MNMGKSTLKMIIYIVVALIFICFTAMILFTCLWNTEEAILEKAREKLHLERSWQYENNLYVDSEDAVEGNKFEYNGKKYTIHCQFAQNYKGYNNYLKSHGCAACSLTTILGAYVPECKDWTPYETITIAEKTVAGEKAMKKNYGKSASKQMPVSLNGISRVLDYYGVKHQYVTKLGTMDETKDSIIQNLKRGDPVIFIVGQKNRETGKYSSKWTGSYHTMIMLGFRDDGKVLIGNPAGKARLSAVSLEEMIDYMFSCSEEPSGFYWNGKKRCGGYIKLLQ